MKIKTIVTAMMVVGTFGAGAVAEPNYRVASMISQLKPVTEVKQISKKNNNRLSVLNKKAAQNEYLSNNAHEGKKRYIVRLIDDSAAAYNGGLKGLDAVNQSSKKNLLNNSAFDPKSTASKNYIAYLDKQQNSFISKASASLGYTIPNLQSYKFAINGLLTELTFAEAQKLAKMPQVAFLEQDKKYQLNTDTGALLIGADEVWDGSAAGSEYKGEGMIIGIIDTGINTDHRSFAETGDDGYTHVNPFGADTYVGDCVANASLCNSKLIGVHSYSVVTDAYSDPLFAAVDHRPAEGEDYNGHGSHTSSTAGGNVLTGVPYVVSDFSAGNVGDGTETPFIMGTMSGVAPHANIISYQVCSPGNTGDTFSGCWGSATVSAIESAITEGVDVLNYSIGGTTPFSPWTSATEIGFLNANAAGIYVATSSGNSGPDASTTTKVAPWYTSTAASNHGNASVTGGDITLGSLSGGDTAAPTDITGGGSNGGFTGDMVWAGDFSNANDPSGDPAQCLQPFPAATFLATQIVVCDRGAIARVTKAANVAVAGAGGFVLANLQGGATNIADDFYAVPGIHIDADDGDVLRTWLASGTGHQGTISAASLTRGTNTVDQIASFSSRGPNTFAQIITPQIAAPGVSVYAAYADDQPFNDNTLATPADFAFLSGTSMAGPHMAGSAALVMQAHPTWNPDQVRSALMMTSTTAMLKEDGVTAADFWDMGAGRVQVNEAVNAGLVMSETQANYLAADPDAGGDPRTLNIPSLANFACGGVCTWTRTFTAVSSGTYAFSSSDANLAIVPASIAAVAGESYSVDISMTVSALSTGDEIYATVDIVSASADLHLPVYAKVNNGAVPDAIDIKAGRNDGSYSVTSIQSVPTDNLIITLNGLFDANASGLEVTAPFDIAEDPTNDVYNDDLDQVFVFEFDVSPNSQSMSVNITASTAPDLDLFVEFDPSGTGGWVLQAQGTTAEALEQVNIDAPAAGKWRLIVQNWAGSGAATDQGEIAVVVVPITDPLPGLSVDAPATADGFSPLDIKLVWDRDMVIGDAFFGDISVYAGEAFIGNFPITLERVENDVTLTADSDETVARGESIDYTIRVNRNLYQDDLDYTLTVDMPKGSRLLEGSVVTNGGNFVISDPNAVGLSLAEEFDIPEDPTNDLYADDLSQVYVLEFDVPNATLDMKIAITAATSPDNDLFLEYDTDGNGSWALIDFSASAQTLESVEVISPVAGKWRAIVQNWAGSSAASDTGTLEVNLTPAKGEGFIWTGVSEISFDAFSVVSSADNALCADGGFGGYLALESFGIGTQGISGDTQTWGAFGGTNFPFFGADHDGIMFTDDGFAIFSGTSGGSPWNNTSIPNAAEPNDMIAAFWRDLEVVDDGTRGIRLATAGPTVAIIEFDELQPWTPSGVSDDRISFELYAFLDAGDTAGDYEYIVAYSGTQVGDFTGATAGVENADGSEGIDASSLIEPGVQLCYDAVKAGDEFVINFSVETTSASVGNPITPTVLVAVDLTGASDSTIAGAPVALVNVGPTANAGPDATYNRSELTAGQITLDAAATVDLDEDQLLFTWTQVGGDEIPLHAASTARSFFNLSEAANGSYTFNVNASDGEFSSSDEVTIVIEGTSAAGGGGGSLGGVLVILMGISFFNRRRFLK